ncbi:MAG TPA: low affinity iron permease family protein [Acidimicrobiales bacterium]|jgi:low affinity Fe/Cu permease|nr:low affinity iron permease family protein [Acidimicrobiales bacterium]
MPEPKQNPRSARKVFDRMSMRVATAAGSPLAFTLAVCVLLVWLLTGPVFGFSDTWQLIINTGTTIITFLMVFLIQHSENKNSRALQIKLDELIAATDRASNKMLVLEDLGDEDLEALHKRFERLAQQAQSLTEQRVSQT